MNRLVGLLMLPLVVLPILVVTVWLHEASEDWLFGEDDDD